MRKRFNVPLPDGKSLDLGERTLIVGVLNVTPDSFSDGGLTLDPGRAVDRALEMQSEAADVIEIGGESTRPGAARLAAEEELARVLPVLKRLAGRLQVPISVDTYKSTVAEAALAEGSCIINDVSALRFDPELGKVVARAKAALVLMHMRGEPATMQKLPPSADIFAEINRDLEKAINTAENCGVSRDRLIIDPGIGFGKSAEQNLVVINGLAHFAGHGLPLMIGTSRKSFLGRITGQPASERLFGTAASVAAAIIRGAHLVRVHDVKQMVEVARVTDAILAQSSSTGSNV